MKKIVAAAVLVIVGTVGTVFAQRYPEQRKIEEENRRLEGMASAAVTKLFEAWGNMDSTGMVKISRDFGPSGETDLLLEMPKSPVTFRDFKMISTRTHDGAQIVRIDVKVTDVASVMSSVIDYERQRKKMGTAIAADFDFILPPKGEALRFMPIRQDMTVLCKGQPSCNVSLCRNVTYCKPRNNILNYAIDAGAVIRNDRDRLMLAQLMKTSADEQMHRKTIWLAHVLFDLGLPTSDAKKISGQAFDLYLKTANGKFMLMEERMRRLGMPMPDNEPTSYEPQPH